ncbi:MAG TPA: VOC family protein [Flavobacteriales bacterium]|nr:VOC family protein [Flavobacteriales bacterium]
MNNTENKSWTNWFEIPVSDMDRAKKFYETIFDISIHVMVFGGFKMGVFPHSNSGAALCQHESYVPSQNGVLVYLNAQPDLNHVLDKIEKAGGKILQSKKHISPEHGHMALFTDTEGNRLALHSTN